MPVDGVLGGLHAVTALSEFVAQMLRALGYGILQAISSEANAGCLDVNNQLIDFHLRSAASPNAIEAVSTSVKMEARSWRMRSTVLAGSSEQISIGSQLITRTLMRFDRLASGSEWNGLAFHPRESPTRGELVDVVKEQLDDERCPGRLQLGFNAGAAAGQTVEHLHVHVIPRFHGDMDDPRGGHRVMTDQEGLLPGRLTLVR